MSQVSDLGLPRRDHDPSPRDFEDWVLATAPRMRRLAFLLTGDLDTAPDLLQSAYAKVLPRWDRVSAMGSPEAYLHRVMVNLRTSWWRRHRNREYAVSEVPESAWPVGSPSEGDRDLDRVVESQRLLAALKAMPERQRVTVVLRYYCDLSEPQTAEAMHCSLGTVKSNASRGLAQLRRLLDDELGDELADDTEIEK